MLKNWRRKIKTYQYRNTVLFSWSCVIIVIKQGFKWYLLYTKNTALTRLFTTNANSTHFKDSAKVHGLIQQCILVQSKQGHLTKHTGNPAHQYTAHIALVVSECKQVLNLCKAKSAPVKRPQCIRAKQKWISFSTPHRLVHRRTVITTVYSTQNSVTVQL